MSRSLCYFLHIFLMPHPNVHLVNTHFVLMSAVVFPPPSSLQIVEAALRAVRMLLRCPSLMQRASFYLWEGTTPSTPTAAKPNTKGGGDESTGTHGRRPDNADSCNGNSTNIRGASRGVHCLDNREGVSSKEGSPWVFESGSGLMRVDGGHC